MFWMKLDYGDMTSKCIIFYQKQGTKDDFGILWTDCRIITIKSMSMRERERIRKKQRPRMGEDQIQ